MENDSAGVWATERYGSAESWRNFVKDGVVDRRRDGSDGPSRGNSVVGVFKVRIYFIPRVATLTSHTLISLTFYYFNFRVCFCLKAIQRVSAMITCSTSFGTLCRYSGWRSSWRSWDWNSPSHTLLSSSLPGFLQLPVRDPGHSGLSQRSWCRKPRGDRGCSYGHLVVKRWSLKKNTSKINFTPVSLVQLVRYFPPCRWDWHVGKNLICLEERVGSYLCP